MADVNKIVEVIKDDLIALFQTILEDDTIGVNTKVNKNTLSDSRLHSSPNTTNNGFQFNLFANYYLEYIERGRRPKETKVPVSALIEWAKRKGIPTDNQTIYAIRNAIWRDGIPARPILHIMDKEIDTLFDSVWSENLFNLITEELDNYFK